jgi:hypothetical protein
MPQSCRHPSTLLFPVPCCLLPVFILCRTSNLPQSQPAPPKTAPFQQLASLPFPGEGALSIVHNQLSSPPAHRPATLPTVHCCRACQQKLSRPESYSGEIRRRRKNTLALVRTVAPAFACEARVRPARQAPAESSLHPANPMRWSPTSPDQIGKANVTPAS